MSSSVARTPPALAAIERLAHTPWRHTPADADHDYPPRPLRAIQAAPGGLHGKLWKELLLPMAHSQLNVNLAATWL
jgi:hypothetical protein